MTLDYFRFFYKVPKIKRISLVPIGFSILRSAVGSFVIPNPLSLLNRFCSNLLCLWSDKRPRMEIWYCIGFVLCAVAVSLAIPVPSSSGPALILLRKFVANHLTVYKVCNVGLPVIACPLGPRPWAHVSVPGTPSPSSRCPCFVDSITQTTHMALHVAS